MVLSLDGENVRERGRARVGKREQAAAAKPI